MNSRRDLLSLGLGLVLLGVCGCGGASSPVAVTSPDRARTALKDAMESWKRGDPYGAPQDLSPPIRVADEDWLSGAKLLDYRLDAGDQLIGTSLRCPVSITLKDAKGRKTKRQVLYSVNTEPVLSVVRQD